MKCGVEGCGAHAVHGKDFCAGHDEETRQKALTAAREARERTAGGLNLPELRTPEDSERFIARVGELLAEGRIKLGLARELRMIGQAWSAVHANRLAAHEFDALRARVEEMEGRRPWRKHAS